MDGIGQIIASYRKAKGLSQKDLSDLLYCSQQFISQVESDKSILPKEYHVKLSKILSFDFVALYKNSENYSNFEHYMLSYELINAIELKNGSRIQEILKEEKVVNEFDYGAPLILKLYCTALIDKNLKKDYKKALDTLLQIFDLKDASQVKDLRLSPSQEYRYYSAILILGTSLKPLNQFELTLALFQNTIEFLENTYFEVLPISSVEHFFKRFYIAILNNYADTLFLLGKHNLSLETCDKAINFATENEILYGLEFLLQLKMEILCVLNDRKEAKKVYAQLLSLCDLTQNSNWGEVTNNLVKEKYPLLLN